MSDHFGHSTSFISDFGNNGNYIEAEAVSTPTNDSFTVAFGSPIFTMVQLVKTGSTTTGPHSFRTTSGTVINLEAETQSEII